MRLSITLLFCTTFLLSTPGLQAAKPLWKEKCDAANGLELRRDHQRALDLYQSALKLLPPNEENARAKILCSIASNMMALKQYKSAFSVGEEAVQLTRKLKAQNKLEADVLLSLQYLLELCNITTNMPDLTYHEKHLHNQRMIRLSLMIKRVLNTKDPDIIDEKMMYARTFVALNNDAQAEKELKQFIAELPPHSPGRNRLQLSLAGLQAKHGKISDFEIDYLKNHKPPVEVMRKVAEGKFWAADYKGCSALLDKALVKLGPTRAETIREEADIYELYAVTKLDCNNFKEAEIWARKRVDLLTKHSNDRGDLRKAQKQLIVILKGQNKNREAATLEATQFSKKEKSREARYGFLFTEDEKAALAKEKATKDKLSK